MFGILYWAARNGLSQLVRDILSKNNDKRGKALYWAAVGDKESIVTSLLKSPEITKDKFQNFFSADGPKALQAAARLGYQEIVKKLLEAFKKFHQEMIAIDDAGHKAVHAAARNGHQEAVKLLIKTLMDCKPDEYRLGSCDEDTLTWSPPHWAIHYNSRDSDVIVRNLLMKGAGSASALEVARKLKGAKGFNHIIIDMLKTPLRVTRKPLELLEPKDQTNLREAACKPLILTSSTCILGRADLAQSRE